MAYLAKKPDLLQGLRHASIASNNKVAGAGTYKPMNYEYQKLGELLVNAAVITPTQLKEALESQAATTRRLGQILVDRGFASDDDIARCLANQYEFELVDPESVTPSAVALACLEPAEAIQYNVLPVSKDEAEIFCLVSDPLVFDITDMIRQRHRRHIRVAIASESKLASVISRLYEGVAPQFQASAELGLAPRFGNAVPRAEFGDILVLDATDSYLDRPVTLFRVPIESHERQAHLDLVKQAANTSDPLAVRIYDSIAKDDYRWTVAEAVKGNTLASVLKFKGKRSPLEAAQIVHGVASFAGGVAANWICPENVWIHKQGFSFLPVVPPSGEYTRADEVESLGLILWNCLVGKADGKFELERTAGLAIPAGMLLVLQRCLVQKGPERYSTRADVAYALSSYQWEGEPKTFAPAPTLDRDELLATLEVATVPGRPSLWRRLFARKAA